MKRTSLVALLVATGTLTLFPADASAYYHAELGRFISRDPIGYTGGINRYAMYSVIGGTDPFGTASLNAAPRNARSMDWIRLDGPFERTLGGMTVPDVGGEKGRTVTDPYEVKCRCRRDNNAYRIACTVNVKFTVCISAFAAPTPKEREQTYRHEQRHVLRTLSYLRNDVIPFLEAYEAMSFDQANATATAASIERAVQKAMDDHRRADQAHAFGFPAAGAGYDPHGPMPGPIKTVPQGQKSPECHSPKKEAAPAA